MKDCTIQNGEDGWGIQRLKMGRSDEGLHYSKWGGWLKDYIEVIGRLGKGLYCWKWGGWVKDFTAKMGRLGDGFH